MDAIWLTAVARTDRDAPAMRGTSMTHMPEEPSASSDATFARLVAAFQALAVGDAMGRATEAYEPAEIEEIYEDAIMEFVEPVRLFDDEQWAAAETGSPTENAIAMALATTATSMNEPSVVDIVHLPRAVAIGAMRPLAAILAFPPANAGIAAVAAAVSAGIEGRPAHAALAASVQAAHAAGDGRLAAAIVEAGGIAQASGGRRAGVALRVRFSPAGDIGALTPFILGLVYATQSARRGILEAVNQGGHAPESAAITGAICAAVVPLSLPPAWAAEVERVNALDFTPIARRCVVARASTGSVDRQE